jgi:hypothetical protein
MDRRWTCHIGTGTARRGTARSGRAAPACRGVLGRA